MPYTKANEQPKYKAKNHQVALVVYQLVSAPINNSGQAVLHARLSACVYLNIVDDNCGMNFLILLISTS